MKTILIAVGSELLRPGYRDTHGEFLTRELERIGWEVGGRRVVPDDEKEIANEVARGRATFRGVVITGGIGPTRDDRTRAGLAGALGRPLRNDAMSERRIRAWCRRRGVEFGARQRRQALVPVGGRAVPNTLGSAPGIWYEDELGWMVALPGIFAELRVMWESVTPRLIRHHFAALTSATLVSTGRGESRLDHRLGRWRRSFPLVEVTTLAKAGEVRVLLRGRGREAGRQVLRFRAALARDLGEDLVSESGERLEEVVLRLLDRRGLSLAVAESCTAGLVAARLTSVPGASRSFMGGAVCYNNRLKTGILRVPDALLRREGAVSRRTAVAMARGASLVTGADVAVAVTGIAGPAGGTRNKPVGTVHWAVQGPAGISTLHRCLTGDREGIRQQAASVALDLVRRLLLHERRPSRRRRS